MDTERCYLFVLRLSFLSSFIPESFLQTQFSLLGEQNRRENLGGSPFRTGQKPNPFVGRPAPEPCPPHAARPLQPPSACRSGPEPARLPVLRRPPRRWRPRVEILTHRGGIPPLCLGQTLGSCVPLSTAWPSRTRHPPCRPVPTATGLFDSNWPSWEGPT